MSNITTYSVDPYKSWQMKYCKLISQYKRCICGGEFVPFIDWTLTTSKSNSYDKNIDDSNLISISYFDGSHHNKFIRNRSCFGGLKLKSNRKRFKRTLCLFCSTCASYKQLKQL